MQLVPTPFRRANPRFRSLAQFANSLARRGGAVGMFGEGRQVLTHNCIDRRVIIGRHPAHCSQHLLIDAMRDVFIRKVYVRLCIPSMKRRLRDRSMRTDHGKSGQSFSVVNLGSLGNLRTSPCVKKDMAVRIIAGLSKAKVRLGTRDQRRDQEAGVEVNCSLSQPSGRDPSRHVRDGLARPSPRLFPS